MKQFKTIRNGFFWKEIFKTDNERVFCSCKLDCSKNPKKLRLEEFQESARDYENLKSDHGKLIQRSRLLTDVLAMWRRFNIPSHCLNAAKPELKTNARWCIDCWGNEHKRAEDCLPRTVAGCLPRHVPGNASRTVCVDPPGNHAVPSDDSDLKCYYSKTARRREMQSIDDLQLFFGLLPPLSSVHNSKNKSNLRKILVWIKAALRRKFGSLISILQKQLLPNQITGKLGNV